MIITLKQDIALEEIGKVHIGVISDGLNDLTCTYVDIDGATLCFVNDSIYLDVVHSLERLTKDNAIKFNIDSFFNFVEPKKKGRTKK